jgi:hypothetical protein
MERKVSEITEKLEARRIELSLARHALDRLQKRKDAAADEIAKAGIEYEIDKQQQHIRELVRRVRELEEELEAAGQFAQGHAVIIGVGADLPTTIQDATALADFLQQPDRCAYPDSQVGLLAGSGATRAGILSALDKLAQSTTPDSTVIVYFSGHGYRVETPSRSAAFYLMAHGYDVHNLSETCISGKEFTARLRAIRSKKLLVLLDCCHAGGIAQPKAPMTLCKSPLPLQAEAVLAEGSGRVVFASSRADEESYLGKSYSQFTIALLEALAGAGAAERDGYARVLDMALYVGRMVPNRTEDKQHPILKVSSLENNFALAYYAGGSKEPLPLPQVAQAQSQVVPTTIGVELAQGYRQLLDKYRYNLLEIEMQMAEFIDQRAVPLDLIRAREEAIKKIEQLKSKYSGE